MQVTKHLPSDKPKKRAQIIVTVSQARTCKEKMSWGGRASGPLAEEYVRTRTLRSDQATRSDYGDVRKRMLKVKEAGFEQVGRSIYCKSNRGGGEI